MQRKIAQASGATLGYIVGNLPGAYIGYKAASMAPIYRKRRGSYGGRMSKRRKPMGLSNFKAKRSNYNVTTTQKDFSTQYRKKSMPRRKKMAWKKFINKVKAATRKDLGLKTVVYNSTAVNSIGPTQQAATALHLYGVRGADTQYSQGAADLVRLFANDPSVQQGIGPSNPLIGKLLFGSATLDVTLHNTGASDLEVDIYYGYHTKDVISTQFVVDDLFGSSLELPINGGTPNTTLDIAQRGVTVFDLPTGLSQSGFHVVKKQKMFMKQTQTSFIQYRDARNHNVEWNRVKQCGYGGRKLTYTVLIVFKTVTGVTENGELSFGVTRKYSYCEDANTKDMSALNP